MYTGQLFVMFVFSVGYFIDYLLDYNKTYYFIYPFDLKIAVSFASIRVGMFILIITKTIYDEWT